MLVTEVLKEKANQHTRGRSSNLRLCGRSLNSPKRARDGAADLKTFQNNPEEDQL